MNQLTSIPGTSRFRSILALIVLLACFTIFLLYTAEISKKVDKIARERVINEINVALSMRLFQSTIEGRLSELSKIHKKNPFIILNGKDYEVPRDYIGQISSKGVPQISGWYYDKGQENIFYWDGDTRLFQYQLQFQYRDVNNSGRYESSKDVIEKLEMVSQ
jgi:hypothetical protein